MKKTIITAVLAFSQITTASQMKWEEIKVQKGYILSIDLKKNKECKNIWTEQIKAFKAMNPQIKNVNLIRVNKKIKVQNCKIEIEPVKEQVQSPIEKLTIAEKKVVDQLFLEVFSGVSFLGEKSKEDSSKQGVSLGAKVGRIVAKEGKKVSMSAGLLVNRSETRDNNDELGVYKLNTAILTLDWSYLVDLSEKLSVGPKLSLGLSDDLSFADVKKEDKAGLYLGLESLIDLKENNSLAISVNQRADDLSRTNILLNFGLRFGF